MDNSDFGKIDFSFPFDDCTQFHSQGSTSDCYKVRINGKWHFLKRPKKELNRNPFYLSAFEKEFDLGFNLEHPNIVRYINKGKDENGTYFITEFIDGFTVDEFIKQNPDYFKQKQHAEKFINQLLSAVSYLHSKQILHLDLKPQNILITHIDHHVKLIDLGFSYSDCHQTLTIGKTDLYAAPEQTNNEKIDQRTDIYGIGMILLYIFTQTADKKSLSKISSNYRHIIRKCLSDSIEDRYFDIASLKKDITQSSKNKPVKYWWLLLVVLCVGLFFLVKPYFEKRGEVKDEAMVVSETNNEGSKEIQDSVRQKPTISESKKESIISDHDYIDNRIEKNQDANALKLRDNVDEKTVRRLYLTGGTYGAYISAWESKDESTMDIIDEDSFNRYVEDCKKKFTEIYTVKKGHEYTRQNRLDKLNECNRIISQIGEREMKWFAQRKRFETILSREHIAIASPYYQKSIVEELEVLSKLHIPSVLTKEAIIDSVHKKGAICWLPFYKQHQSINTQEEYNKAEEAFHKANREYLPAVSYMYDKSLFSDENTYKKLLYNDNLDAVYNHANNILLYYIVNQYRKDW